MVADPAGSRDQNLTITSKGFHFTDTELSLGQRENYSIILDLAILYMYTHVTELLNFLITFLPPVYTLLSLNLLFYLFVCQLRSEQV